MIYIVPKIIFVKIILLIILKLISVKIKKLLLIMYYLSVILEKLQNMNLWKRLEVALRSQ